MKTRLSVIIAMLVSLAVSGCAAGAQPTTTIQVPMGDVLNQKIINRDVALAVGDRLEVSLGANHSTLYRWTAQTQIADPTIVQQTSHEYVAPNPPGIIGAPGTEVWKFNALKTGTTTIVTDYRMSTDPMHPACTFTANVTVQ
jgi:inhibitor of cysteine peptidase